MMKIGGPYHMYMMEQEGLLNTREGRINALIKEFKNCLYKGWDINDDSLQAKLFNKHNLNDLTDKEKRRIAREVVR